MENIDAYINNNEFRLRVINSYFDYNDIEDPIKYFIDDRIFYPLKSFAKPISDIFVMRAEA